MNITKDKDIVAIKNAWDKLISGQEVEQDTVSSVVYESWLRSKQAGVNPFELNKNLYLTEEEKKYYSDSFDIYDSQDIVSVLKEIAFEMNLSFLMFDSEGKIQKILAVARDNELFIPRDLSENVVGTNAICLALQQDTPIQLLGEEHYNQILQNAKCTAAPIHDTDGKIISVINIGGFNAQKHTLETMAFVDSIAKSMEKNIRISKMLKELTAANIVFNEIFEHSTSGLLYINEKNNMSYNRFLIDLLEIKEISDEQKIHERIYRILDQISNFRDEEEIINKELFLKIKNKQKSYLVSMIKVKVDGIHEMGYLYRFDDTSKLLSNIKRNSGAVYRFEDIIGENGELKKAKDLAMRAARTSSAILIHGESGSGKELFAQAIHNESFRKDKPFVAINCGAIPSELIESELFGYEPGAFTGAAKGVKLGKLEIASGGTFFFDEVESMPLNVQVKLLRALSTNKITRIGGIEEIPIDIRIIAATKKDLLQEAEQGNFREDLYFRINIISVNIPPLRERKDDIHLLAKDFIKYYAKEVNLGEIEVEPEFLESLTYYYWRGNIRELKNVIEKVVLLNDDTRLTVNNLPPKIQEAYRHKSLKEKIDNKVKDIKKGKDVLRKSEEMVIELVLNEEKWNLTKGAERLGISRSTLYKKIEDYPRLKKLKEINDGAVR